MKTGEGCIQIIACGVLAVDLKHAAEELGLNVRLRFLSGGLHATPHELRNQLQEAIDEVSGGDVERIVVGYGVCGRGTVGIEARGVPLVIPRVHDCIALFLGSDARYRAEFSRHPGTFYLSAGWVEEKGTPATKRRMGSDGADSHADAHFHSLIREYGESNAQYIRDFMDSWKRNYTRSAFIDSGVGGRKEHYAKLAETMAHDCGWQYERLNGTHELLHKMLQTTQTTNEILVVPPSGKTYYDAIRRRLSATATAEPGLSAESGAGLMTSDRAEPAPRSGVGLGIDAGGTYTDAVLYDFEKQEVVGKGKALTTRWNFTIGIDEALDSLDAGILGRVNMVAVSTTLATNAIVEGRGQRTGLMVMPPCGWQDVSAFRHEPVAVIAGQLSIDGTELEPVDLDQVRSIARDMVDSKGVAAFAVGGYAGHANPSHELAVKRAIEEETGLHVSCGHELSEGLNYRVRSETAALNARIIPCLKTLLDRLQPALAARRISAPVMVVRSDGSLMNLETALDRPLETMLSGPAASVAGAAHLAKRRDAVVVDVGGTTTDTAILRNGVVEMCEDGATIGGWQTHVRALDLATLGLGGDSHICLDRGAFTIGPRRVAPVSWLATHVPGCDQALAWLESHQDAFTVSTKEAAIYAATGGSASDLDANEQRLLDLLRERPRSLHEAVHAMGVVSSRFLPLHRLEELHLVQCCGFTPTDLQHVLGVLDLWDSKAAARFCSWHARLAREPEEDLARKLVEPFQRHLAAELFKKTVAGEIDMECIDAQPAALALIDKALKGSTNGCDVQLSLAHPVIGIGAPAHCFVPQAAERLNTEAVVPEHADVANAVGAIAGAVALKRHVGISIDELGQYRLVGVPGAPVFASIEDATTFGAGHLRRELIQYAEEAGAANPSVEIAADDSVTTTATGEPIFVGRTIVGSVTSLPAMSE